MWRSNFDAGDTYVGILDNRETCFTNSAINAKPVIRTPARSRSEKAKDPKIAVCVKGLDFLQSFPPRILVEWIELQFLLGASAITMYKYHVPREMERVLQHYSTLQDGRKFRVVSHNFSIFSFNLRS